MAKAMRIEIATVNPQSGNWLYAGLDLPAEEYEIRDAFQRARMASGGTYREYLINECEALPLLVGQRLDSPTVRELNFLAQRLESLDNEERLVLQAVASKYIGREEDVVVSVKDLINLTYGLDEVMVASNVKDVGELGRFVIENDMNELFENIPTDVLPYLDKSKIGQMQQQIDGGVFLNNQYVVADAYELREVYNGRELPDENLHARYAFRLEVSSPPDNDDDLDDAVQSAHWVTLPLDKGKANEVARECGQARIEDCVYFGFESTIPQIASDNFGDMQDFDKLNQLAELLLEMTPADQAKFKAVLSAEESRNLADILDVAKNLHQYEFAPQVEDAAHFFKSYLERHLDTRFDTKWLDGVLLRDEGYELLGRLGGTLTNYGAISVRGGSLYELVPRREPEQMPDQDETKLTMGGM